MSSWSISGGAHTRVDRRSATSNDAPVRHGLRGVMKSANQARTGVADERRSRESDRQTPLPSVTSPGRAAWYSSSDTTIPRATRDGQSSVRRRRTPATRRASVYHERVASWTIAVDKMTMCMMTRNSLRYFIRERRGWGENGRKCTAAEKCTCPGRVKGGSRNSQKRGHIAVVPCPAFKARRSSLLSDTRACWWAMHTGTAEA